MRSKKRIHHHLIMSINNLHHEKTTPQQINSKADMLGRVFFTSESQFAYGSLGRIDFSQQMRQDFWCGSHNRAAHEVAFTRQIGD